MSNPAIPGSARTGARSGANIRAHDSDAVLALRERIAAKRRHDTRRRHRTLLVVRLLSLAIVFGAWEVYGLHTIPILFAPISKVVASGWALFVHGGLGSELLYSVKTFAFGFLMGGCGGIAIGLFLGTSRIFEAAVSMYIFALYATPMIALSPIISLWMGFGFTAQVVIVSLFVTWPMTVTVYHGVRNIDRDLLEVAQSLRLNRAQMWRHVLLPGAIPYMLTGATQGIAVGLVGVFVAETQTEFTGLGNALMTAASTYHTADALAVVLVVMLLGLTLRILIGVARRRLAPWMSLDR